MKTVETSRRWLIDSRDFFRGLLMAIIGAVLTFIIESSSAGELVFNWQKIGYVAFVTGAGYVLKNWIEPSKTITKTNQ
jgi:hypothetical protein